MDLHVLPMEKTKMTKGLLDKYYETLSGKGECGPLLSEGFSLKGAQAQEARGREEYGNILFFTYVESLKVKTMIIDGEHACAEINYALVSPKGDSLSCDAAEIWRIKNGKLDSMTMYFDTAAYQKFMLPILFPLTRLKRKNRP